MSAPTFSVILPTYNRSAVVERTLHNLLAIDYPADAFEIIVVDNSTDETPEMVEGLGRSAPVALRLLSSSERLPAVKRNQGLREARGDLVLFMNDDLWVTPDFLQEHAATHARFDDPVAVVGRVDQSDEMPWTPFVEWYAPFPYHEIDRGGSELVTYRFFWSMNLSLQRQVMLDHQLVFHEDWAEIGHEDIELGYRWTRVGYEVVYNPRARGGHYHPHTLDSACRLQESIGRGLRDLEWLIPEPDLLERYGIFTWQGRPRAVIRGLGRRLLFNRWTTPLLRARLSNLSRRSRLAEWSYWKVMLHYTNKGYREMPPRQPRRMSVVMSSEGAQ